MKPNQVKEFDARGRRALEKLVGELPAGDTEFRAALTGSVIGKLPLTTGEQVPEIFARAREVQSMWAQTPFSERRTKMLAFHDLLLDHRHELLDLLQWETAKARASAFEEVADVAINARYYARNADKLLSTRKVGGAVPVLTKARVYYKPKGVVGVITPWNYPLTLVASDALAALMAGNAVVLKPDSQTPFTAFAVQSLFEKAGFPPGLFQIVVGAGSVLGTPMIEHADYVMFTGSTATGRTIAEQAGRNLVGFSAEMGGKNALIVRRDAHVGKAAVGALRASFSNSGQLCISIERIYVHTDIWDEFVPAFVRKVKSMRVGPAMDFSTDMGPLINQSQLDKVKAHVDDAVAKGATVLAGGQELPDAGQFGYAPTVLTGVTAEMDVFAEETFGPVVSLYRVADDAEAIELANATDYGLNASVWTGSLAAGEAVAAQLETGMVNVNEGYAAGWGSIGAPNGGVKDSGMAHRHGPEGIRKYCDMQTIATQRLVPIKFPAPVMTAFLKVLRRVPPQIIK
ncbi:MAG: succinate-semialdehyde dehydrogenase (NADP(+)) [Actinomycetaceae bacterium]|nr:succinate-semialdehyde dehydrogenase (NADP(+)) [Actinomycetaceae bacterium]